MNLRALKSYFKEKLLGYYPDSELEAFFYVTAEHYLGYQRIDVSIRSLDVVEAAVFDKFIAVVERLKTYEPIQYILGVTTFCGWSFKVTSDVLIPRPETEELVEWIVENVSNKASLRILDIGTGSGCIAIALAKLLPHAKVSALDVSPGALEVAKSNAKENDVDVRFIETSVLDPDPAFKSETWDVIVSNPPYVRHLEKSLMHANVLEYEPHLALFVEDDDALQFYKAITALAETQLNEEGHLYFEINEYLGTSMLDLLKSHAFKEAVLKKDIHGKDRMTKAIKL